MGALNKTMEIGATPKHSALGGIRGKNHSADAVRHGFMGSVHHIGKNKSALCCLCQMRCYRQ